MSMQGEYELSSQLQKENLKVEELSFFIGELKEKSTPRFDLQKEIERVTKIHFLLTSTVFDPYDISYQLSNVEGSKDVLTLFKYIKHNIENKLKELQKKKALKFQIAIQVKMYRVDEPELLLEGQELDLHQIFDILQEKMEKITRMGSGWVLDRIEKLYLNIGKYAPFKGASYIPTPEWLVNKQAIVNVKNKKKQR